MSGQHKLGLKINGGLSKISNSFNSSNSNGTDKFTLSGQTGFFFNMNLGAKSVLGGELLFNQIEGKDNFRIEFTDATGNSVGFSNGNIFKHISYLSVPIYYGIKFNKTLVNVGFQTSFVLANSGRQKGKATLNGEESEIDLKYDKLFIDRMDFGPRAGIIFDLNDNFAVEGTFYYGIKNLLGSPSSFTWKIQQATVGFRYTFLEIKKN